jgi:hypothetical protein
MLDRVAGWAVRLERVRDTCNALPERHSRTGRPPGDEASVSRLESPACSGREAAREENRKERIDRSIAPQTNGGTAAGWMLLIMQGWNSSENRDLTPVNRSLRTRHSE